MTGLATFILPKQRDAFPAGLRGEPIDKIGYHGMTTWQLWFDGVRVPLDHRIGWQYAGTGGDGAATRSTFALLQTGLNVARVHTAARAVGLGDVPLLCARELDIVGGTPRCIRVLMHLTTERSRSDMRHVYLEGAVGLRDDLPG